MYNIILHFDFVLILCWRIGFSTTCTEAVHQWIESSTEYSTLVGGQLMTNVSCDSLVTIKISLLFSVGDPRGVSSCSGYGDSFLQVGAIFALWVFYFLIYPWQLKKVRLRTTFASEDTSSSGVVLSCCEHYGNMLYRYNNSELKAVRVFNFI